jgi:glycine/serine hydroxymethyltransferase
MSGKWFNVVPYGLDKDQRDDMDEVERWPVSTSRS